MWIHICIRIYLIFIRNELSPSGRQIASGPMNRFLKTTSGWAGNFFFQLCELLPGLRKSDTKLRKAIPLEKRVAIALYALGSSAEYRTIANMFGVGKATVCKILLSFCAEVWRVLAPTYLNNFPMNKEKIESLVQEFEALGFPQCMGALGKSNPLSYFLLLIISFIRRRMPHRDPPNPRRRHGLL